MHDLAITIGLIAVLWCGILAGIAVSSRKFLELYMTVGVALWLIGNFVWMQGEVTTQDDVVVVPRSAIILETALSWLMFYYFILRPLNVLPVKTQMYEVDENEKDLVPRYPLSLYFVNWRDYEHVHTLFWCAKDLCWNRLQPIVWWFCIIPTGLIAIDFIITSFGARDTIACVHYTAILLWVMGNAAWAYANIYHPYLSDDTYSHSMFSSSFESYDDYVSMDNTTPFYNTTVRTYHSNSTNIHGRWEASWLIFTAASLLAMFYILWISIAIVNFFRFSSEDLAMIKTQVATPISDTSEMAKKNGEASITINPLHDHL
jgi:hypothetical protein